MKDLIDKELDLDKDEALMKQVKLNEKENKEGKIIDEKEIDRR
jgi:hypothetical protein